MGLVSGAWRGEKEEEIIVGEFIPTGWKFASVGVCGDQRPGEYIYG